MILFSLVFISQARADEDTDIINSIPGFLNNNNLGTDFWFTVPPCFEDESAGYPNKIKLLVTSFTKTWVTVNAKYNYLLKKEVKPFEITEFELPLEIAQPYSKNGRDPAVAERVFQAAAINVEANDPIACYLIVKFKNTGDGFVVIPVSALGSKYIVSSYGDASSSYPGYYSFPSISGIVACFDNTEVKFKVGGNLTTMTANEVVPGDSIVKILNKGDVLMISTRGKNSDLSGSLIESSKPVAVVSGNQCANIPIENMWCDYIAEMETPVSTWGYSYIAPKIIGRKFSPVLRIFAKENDTKISVNGEEKYTISKAGGLIDEGYIETRINKDSSAKAALIQSDKPISVTLYNSGVQEDGNPQPIGDPFQMVLSAAEQYQKEIIYLAPKTKEGWMFQENYFAITIKTKDSLPIPDNFKIGTRNNNVFDYNSLSSLEILDTMVFKSKFDDSYFSYLTIKVPNASVFHFKSDNPFACYAYGFNSQDGYGFPASLGLKKVDTNDKEAPFVEWQSDCNGEINGFTKDLPTNYAIRANLTYPIYMADSSYNFDKEFQKIIPGITEQIEWKLKIRDLNKDARGVIIFRDAADNDTTIIVRYSSPKLSIEPNKHDFGMLKVGEESSKKFTIKNLNDKPFDLSLLRFLSNSSIFEFVGQLPYGVLGPGEAKEIEVKIRAKKPGDFKDSIGLGDDCILLYRTQLIASVGNPNIIASDLNFGEKIINKTYNLPATVLNNGKSKLTITKVILPKSSAYKVNFDREISDANPLVLDKGEVFSYNVDFKPEKEEIYSDNIIFCSDANTTDSIAVLFGRGVLPGLVAYPYDWNRKRIIYHSNSLDYPIYSNGLLMKNEGTANAYVNLIEISGDDLSKKAFEIDYSNLQSKTFIPGESDFAKLIRFAPKTPGYFKVDLTVTFNNKNKTQSYLSGIAVVPRIEIDREIDFGLIQKEKSEINKQILRISNQDLENWIFGDTLLINDLKSDKISLQGNDFGEYGFRIDKSRFNFPIKLSPGESIDIPIEYKIKELGEFSADLIIVSDAESHYDTVVVKAKSMDNVIVLDHTKIESCIDQESVFEVSLTNPTIRSIDINQVKFEVPLSEYSFEDNDIMKGFSIEPGKTKKFNMLFNPYGLINKTAKLYFYDAYNSKLLDSLMFTGKTLFVERELLVNPVAQTATIGQKISTRVSLNKGDNIDFANINNLKVEINYNPTVVSPDLKTLVEGTSISGKFLIVNISNTNSLLAFDLKSIAGDILPEKGELFKLEWNVFLPNQEENEYKIDFKLKSLDNKCVSFDSSSAKFTIIPTCAFNLRKVKISNVKYDFERIAPNPVRTENIDLNFSIGLNSFTELSIINSNGELILKPVNQLLEPGEYSVGLDLTNFASGVYFVRFKSGPYSDTQKIIINK